MTTDELVEALKDINNALIGDQIYIELGKQNLEDVIVESSERIGELLTTISDQESEIASLQESITSLETELEEEIAAR